MLWDARAYVRIYVRRSHSQFCFAVHETKNHLSTPPVWISDLHARGRWVDVSRWGERGVGNKPTNSKSAVEEIRARVPTALRGKHPSLPVVVLSGLPFHKTQDEVM